MSQIKVQIVLILLLCYSLSTIQQEEKNIGKWQNCTQSQFISQLKSTNFNIYKPVRIPSPIGCDSITVPEGSKYYPHLMVRDTFRINEFRYSGSRNLCVSNKILEIETNFNCTNLCFNSDSEVWNNKTSIYDWINYCQYCRNASGFENYHQLRLSHSCNNTKQVDSQTRIVDIIESIPNDIRYCGIVNIGLPLVVGPLLDSYAIICYCEKHNLFEFDCAKHGWENVLKEMLDYGGIVVFSLLFMITISLLLIPKLVNYLRKVPGFTFLRLIPSMSLTLSSLCYIVNYALYFTSYYSVASSFLMMAELMLFYSLFPILMRWYGMASLISQQQHGKSNSYSIKRVYVSAVILFLIAVLFVCFVTILIPYLIGDQYFLYTYVAISWLSEIVCLTMFIITSRRLNSVLKKLSDIVSNTVPFIKLSNFAILFVLVISFIDLNTVFAKLANDRAFLAYCELFVDVLYCILFCRIVLFDFDFEDFKTFKKQTSNNQQPQEELKPHDLSTSTTTTNGTSNASTSYYLLDN